VSAEWLQGRRWFGAVKLEDFRGAAVDEALLGVVDSLPSSDYGRRPALRRYLDPSAFRAQHGPMEEALDDYSVPLESSKSSGGVAMSHPRGPSSGRAFDCPDSLFRPGRASQVRMLSAEQSTRRLVSAMR